MSRVIRHRCDSCNREADPVQNTALGREYPADGWWTITGEWGGGEPYDEHHLCSVDCIVEWGNKQRRGAELVQAHPGIGKWTDPVTMAAAVGEPTATSEIEIESDNAIAAAAYEALAARLWSGNRPHWSWTVEGLDTYADSLPEDEAAALNAMLGESFGRRPLGWESNHPISVRARTDDDEATT